MPRTPLDKGISARLPEEGTSADFPEEGTSARASGGGVSARSSDGGNSPRSSDGRGSSRSPDGGVSANAQYGDVAANAPDAAQSGPGAPLVRQDADARTLQFKGYPAIQSRMSLLKPYALDLEYTRMMMGFLLFNSAPERIAMIGLGGGSLAKFCHRYLPASRVDVVEIDAGVIALRNDFLVPADDERFAVIHADGADFVRQAPEFVDILLVDGYDMHGLPAQLCSQDFYDDCHRMLRPDGILVVNLHLEGLQYQPCLHAMLNTFGAGLLEVVDDDMTNSVVFACKGDLLRQSDMDNIRRPDHIAKDAWRQLMPTFQVIAATLTLR
jgi:spermidine synthase